jgi:dUTP pyrophosphatase
MSLTEASRKLYRVPSTVANTLNRVKNATGLDPRKSEDLSKLLLAVEEPMAIKIKIKYFSRGIPKLQKISVGDWIDLYAADYASLAPGQYALIPLGVGMILPDGYEAHVVPRSSTCANFGIIMTNGTGIIDNSYSGDNDQWHFPAVAVKHTVIKPGDKIAQFRIVKNQPPIEFEEVRTLNPVSRGGIGSTGAR